MATIPGGSGSGAAPVDLGTIGANQSLGTTNTFGAVINLGSGMDTVSGSNTQQTIINAQGSTVDVVLNNAVGDTVWAGAGNDTVSVGGSFNRVELGTGNNTATVTGNNNLIQSSGTGSASITVTGGENQVNTGAGNDYIDDHLGHNNYISGLQGDDTVLAGSADEVSGGDGNDLLDARGSTAAILSGGAGNDTLISGINTTMVGDGGNDTFQFSAGFGNDTITSFQIIGNAAGTDQLVFSAGTYGGSVNVASAADVVSHATVSGSGVLITLGTDTIKITGITLAELQAHPTDYIKVH